MTIEMAPPASLTAEAQLSEPVPTLAAEPENRDEILAGLQAYCGTDVVVSDFDAVNIKKYSGLADRKVFLGGAMAVTIRMVSRPSRRLEIDEDHKHDMSQPLLTLLGAKALSQPTVTADLSAPR